MGKHLMIMGKKLYMCDTCNKKLSSYHSLWRHKRNGICQNKQRNNQENEYSDIQTVPEIIRSDSESAASSSKFDQTSEDEIPTDDEQQYPTNNDSSDWNWEKLVIMSCHNNKCSSLDLFKTYIRFYIDSKRNPLFKSIMNDVADGELHEQSLQKAIQFAVKKNEISIINTVKNCSDKEEDNDNWFWCRLVELGKDLDCQWLNGKPCYCTEHYGMSLLDTICVFVKLFIAMGKDDVIERIESDIDDKRSEMSLNDAIDQVVTSHKKEILLSFREARKTIDACGIWNRYLFFQ